MNSMWFYLIKNYANSVAILTIDWTLTFSVMTTAVVAFLVQSFYAYRTYVLGGKEDLLPSIIITLGLASLVLAVDTSSDHQNT
ncbi:hypothetical protein M422DRAFT_265738 [Sphaerobolus stellatus SS14]|uniref:Unplaced genomic scaffold SPHSTscaffold_152, whole genome shotgun sequence n=1 Tax=Sphaerobolus stellatus (strain SS14) TaxID=990650 RepID=A0A0C9UCN8_SPHS4|nr:hypothetical protein M422DRAFT_265738 [Sphaerobolus stellatus SS14]